MSKETSSDAAPRRRLGRGLSSLLGGPVAIDVRAPAPASEPPARIENGTPPAPQAAGVSMIAVAQIVPNPAQPRRRFDDKPMAQLAESIKSAGVMQPVILRRGSSGGEESYELVAGERRWRAAQLAGLEVIPAMVKALSDEESAQWALIENLQREDLGPLEKAAALKSLAERFSLTHAEVAQRVGLERVTVTNMIRLLELEPDIATALESGQLSMGHGRALLGVPPGPARLDLAAKAILNHWSVRRLEREAADIAKGKAQNPSGAGDRPAAESLLQRQAGVQDLERQLSEYLGTKVRLLLRQGGTRGQLIAEFFDLDHFDALMARMGFKAK